MIVVRLWEQEDGTLSVLERSGAELARAKRVGGRVYDVSVDHRSRKAAEDVLHASRAAVDETVDPEAFDRVQRLKRRVVEVTS
jgi:hypothetical protein